MNSSNHVDRDIDATSKNIFLTLMQSDQTKNLRLYNRFSHYHLATALIIPPIPAGISLPFFHSFSGLHVQYSEAAASYGRPAGDIDHSIQEGLFQAKFFSHLLNTAASFFFIFFPLSLLIDNANQLAAARRNHY